MNPTDLAYLAGIIDGEGCLGIHYQKGGRSRTRTYYPRVTVGSTNRAVLEWIHEQLSGTFWALSPSSNTRGKKSAWYWGIGGERLIRLLEALEPYLRIKATQARLLREFWAQRTRCGNKGVPPEEQALRHGYHLAVMTANQQGL